MTRHTPRKMAGSWSSRMTFFWAATGATVGLSNFWTFPGLLAERGGSLFLSVYLVCLIVMTLPLMLTETAIGRYARHGVILAVDQLAKEAQAPVRWLWLGRLGLVAGLMLLAFLSVIGGICLSYLFDAAIGRFNQVDEPSLIAHLSGLVRDPDDYRPFMGWHAGFLLLVAIVSMQGVRDGLGRGMRVMVPLMMVLLVALFVYSTREGQFGVAVDRLLRPHWPDFGFESIRLALTHAFYTLSLGVGVLVVLGAYSAPTSPIKRTVVTVALIDSLIGIVAGLVIYAIVASPLENEPSGFELVFLALPQAISELPGGQFVLTGLLMMLTLAAWTSALALMEPGVNWLREKFATPRGWTVWLVALAAWLVGLTVLFSFNRWADLVLWGGTVYRWLDLVSGSILIPVVSILTSFFVGWAIDADEALRLIGRGPTMVRYTWLWVTRLVLPAIVLYIGVHSVLAGFADLCGQQPGLLWCGGSSHP